MNNPIFTTQEYVIFTTQNGNKFYCTQSQFNVLKTLETCHAGGFAKLYGYVAKTGRIEPSVTNFTLITRTKTHDFYAKKLAKMASLSFDDVKDFAMKDEKLSQLSDADLLKVFNDRLAKEMASMNGSIAGTLKNAHTEAHARNYATIVDGIRVNYSSEKIDGIQTPILTDGLPTVSAILVNGFSFKPEVITAGKYKIVNSGLPVRMSKAILKALNVNFKGMNDFKTYSLNPDNFDRLKISKNEIIPSHLKEFVY